ncbi:MAG: translation elongation factor Ts [Alphaproteobacteria bacterium]|nr:translation elongation factor Ts [Alphaproteobacteria bacterium]MCB9792558.1 translation elongation factor Ts [Alphaproteobacteria bacterium]
MSIAAKIKELRERTGAGMLDCKKALAETDGDLEAAVDWLRTKGIAKAAKKAGRVAAEGLVHAYIHGNGRIGVLVEVNAETDFVARAEPFQELVKKIAMHIAAAAPVYLRQEDIPEEDRLKEREIQIARVVEEGKPKHIAERIVDGRMGKWFEEVCLLDQKFVMDDSKTIGELIAEAIGTIGENIQIRRYARFVLGEGIEKKQDDFAAEVAAQAGLA